MKASANLTDYNAKIEQGTEEFHIPATKKTPEVYLNKKEGLLKISGRSMPIRANDFYFPVMRQLDEYLKTPNNRTKIDINLEYADSSSSKLLLAIIMRLRKLKENRELEILWCYSEDDHDMKELGKMISDLSGCNIELLLVS